jgi:hypothetical protein
MVKYGFLNIYMNNKEQLAMINMSLKRHHINVYIKKCDFENDLTWFLAPCFMLLSIIETYDMIWNESNEDETLENIHN